MHIVVIQDGVTVLMKASEEGNTAMVELLLQHGADVNFQNKVRNVMYCSSTVL